MKLKIEGGYDHNASAPKQKVLCFFPSPCFGFKEVVLRHDIAVKITEINIKLDAIAKEKGDYNLNVIPANERPDYQRMRLALSERPAHECEKLEEIGKEIVKKCKGLPLATKTIGSLLQFKRSRDEWQRVLYSEMWKLEEIEKGLLSPLMLSYNDLPSSIRKCFSYCAVFPLDYHISKDELIKLWMAQGYLGLEKNTKLETIGEEYFHHLATRSFFQELLDSEDDIWGCKMHDIVHDFALFLSNGECLAIEVNICDNDPFINSSNKNVCHLMLKVNKGVSFPMSICSVKSLRSLIVIHDGGENSVSGDVLKKFCELTCLRSLRFPRCGVEDIPKEIKKLVHLRYLDLSGQNIVKLPESLCELYNLHTLDISGCSNIHELPLGIEKLVNLRQLVNERIYSLHYIPKGIKRLTALRTLSKFVVSGGGDHDSKACMLEGLKNLNHLEGSLEITGLGNLTNVSEAEMKEVLKNKENLTILSLNFDILGEEERLCEDDELVLEVLLPPPKLEWLLIGFYRGNSCPSTWMTSLTKLKELHLLYFSNCKNLHPLGKLPSLEKLIIRSMENVKEADSEFWGMESGASSSSSSSCFFPKLIELEIWDVEWEWGRFISEVAKIC
ncbi:putative disease resistance protein RGA3 [Pistacia vera]|uniref:putative disease resistance protein RGA3 n=1 Tax=Pistacia vera TaxID=55513 RepID=UPI001262E937|nr:putative disease resistance protein RGA3 [Pistacia vera]